LAGACVRADVKLPAVISDNMALQQGQPVPIWGWADAGEDVSVTFAGQTKTAKAGEDKKWSVTLDALKVGEPAELTVKGKNTIVVMNVIVGEVWVCSGQSNMEFGINNANNAKDEIANAKFPKIRLFTVKKKVSDVPVYDCEGKWTECSPETINGFTAVGYFFGRKLHQELNVPVGLIHTSWGGTPIEAWMSPEALGKDADFKPILERYAQAKAQDTPENWTLKMDKHKAEMEKWKLIAAKAKAEGQPAPRAPRQPQHIPNSNSPSALYNAMIVPILPYAIAGSTWYQGEANAGRAYQYRKLLPGLIADWRTAFACMNSSFMVVQLANFMDRKPEPSESAWAELREAQTMAALNVPKTGIGLAIDIGDAKDIHPKNKQDVGARLALQALKISYGKNIPFSGPLYDSFKSDGSKAVVNFKYAFGGLKAKDGELKGFAVAGEDKKFVWATAKIEGDTVVVSSDKVARIAAVRYAWADNPEANLYNGSDLPAVPFRSDSWPGITEGKN
jgi:sialate O-acetylesterase